MRDDKAETEEKSLSPEGRKSRSTSRSSIASKKSVGSQSSYSKSRSRSRSRSSDRDGYRLHIADIGEDVRKTDLEKLFAPYGTLKEVWMTNSTPCFGFAVFKDRKSASAALRATDGIEVAGCRIHVTHARPRTRGSGRRFFNSNMRCYQCGYSGHFYRDCPEANGGGGGDKRDRYDRDRGRRGQRRDRREREDRYGRSGGGGGGGGYGAGGGGGGRSSRRRYDDSRPPRSSRRNRY